MVSVLVVDDEPVIRQRLMEHPHLVLLDVAMPIMGGLAVCRAVRAEPSLGR